MGSAEATGLRQKNGEMLENGERQGARFSAGQYGVSLQPCHHGAQVCSTGFPALRTKDGRRRELRELTVYHRILDSLHPTGKRYHRILDSQHPTCKRYHRILNSQHPTGKRYSRWVRKNMAQEAKSFDKEAVHQAGSNQAHRLHRFCTSW